MSRPEKLFVPGDTAPVERTMSLLAVQPTHFPTVRLQAAHRDLECSKLAVAPDGKSADVTLRVAPVPSGTHRGTILVFPATGPAILEVPYTIIARSME
jgi:hypothetical protein